MTLSDELQMLEDSGDVGRALEGLPKQALQLEERVERLEIDLTDAEGALWRVVPHTFSLCGEDDPFEGSGETYHDAYKRVSADNQRLESVLYLREMEVDGLLSINQDLKRSCCACREEG